MDTEGILNRVGVCKNVFSFLYPETKEVVDELFVSRPHHMYERSWQMRQDTVHDEFISEWKEWVNPWVKGLDNFKYSYYSNGSSEAIREAIAEHVIRTPSHFDGARIHMFNGDYEGYGAFAEAYGAQVVRYNRDKWREELEDGADLADDEVFFLSQPSSIDGNYWDEYEEFMEFISNLIRPRIRVMLDLAYVGCTPTIPKFRTDYDCIDKIFFSLSKPFGVYYHRIGGVLSRSPMQALYGNKWFKNLFSIELGRQLLCRYSPTKLPKKYNELQKVGVKQFSELFKCEAKPSDVILLGYSDSAEDISVYDIGHYLERAGKTRFCITPFLDRVNK